MSTVTNVSFFAWSIPFILLWIVGIILAVSTLHKHRTPSTLVLLACTLLLMEGIGGRTLTWMMLYNRDAFDMGGPGGILWNLVNLSGSGLRLIGYILLLVAVYSGRDEPVRPRRQRYELDLPEPESAPDAIRKPDRHA